MSIFGNKNDKMCIINQHPENQSMLSFFLVFFQFWKIIIILTSSTVDKKLEIYKNLEIELEIYKNLEIELEIYKNLENFESIFEFFCQFRVYFRVFCNFEFFVNGRWTHYNFNFGLEFWHRKNLPEISAWKTSQSFMSKLSADRCIDP